MSRLRSSKTVRTRSFVACAVGGTIYVLPVEEVQEIVQPMALTQLPHAPPGIIGAVEHREEVVPILDLAARLGWGQTTDSKSKWVLVRGHGKTLGIVVAQVLEVFEIAESSIRPAPELGDVAARAATSVLNYRTKMAFVLSMESIAKLADVALRESESA
jgi:purine-binding chemotaxis protein CheW